MRPQSRGPFCWIDCAITKSDFCLLQRPESPDTLFLCSLTHIHRVKLQSFYSNHGTLLPRYDCIAAYDIVLFMDCRTLTVQCSLRIDVLIFKHQVIDMALILRWRTGHLEVSSNCRVMGE